MIFLSPAHLNLNPFAIHHLRCLWSGVVVRKEYIIRGQ